jgi:hypothetical protein
LRYSEGKVRYAGRISVRRYDLDTPGEDLDTQRGNLVMQGELRYTGKGKDI